jgi:hypothetical protein
MLTRGRPEVLSRRDIPTIARRFSAGYDAQTARVPKGRLRLNPTNQDIDVIGRRSLVLKTQRNQEPMYGMG